MWAVVMEARRELWVPWDAMLQMGVRHHVATGYQTQTLWKSNKCFYVLIHISRLNGSNRAAKLPPRLTSWTLGWPTLTPSPSVIC